MWAEGSSNKDEDEMLIFGWPEKLKLLKSRERPSKVSISVSIIGVGRSNAKVSSISSVDGRKG